MSTTYQDHSCQDTRFSVRLLLQYYLPYLISLIR
nr:MAG TPA: hypothetical protein [Bacteriophage sp.]DAO24096.1 MAG TPA: hypothetical protein [Caudoviricetes sp.]